MVGYLIGVYECKVDSKARLMVPVQLKKQLGAALTSPFILKRSVFHTCLELFTIDSWNNVVKDINQLNRFVKKNNDFIRMFTAGVKVVALDVTGRLLIPKDLQSYARISKELVLSSSANMIEIWDKIAYESIIHNKDIDFAQLAEEVMGLKTTQDE